MTFDEKKQAINRLIDQMDRCVRAYHDQDDAALQQALDDLISKANFFRARVPARPDAPAGGGK